MRTGRTRVVIVSGRAIDHLLPLLGLETPPEIWGSHGREVRYPDGSIHFAEPDTEQQKGLTRALELIQTQVPGNALETKPASLAVHSRGMSEQDSETLMLTAKQMWGPLAEDSGLRLHEFDGGLELRAPGVDKGTAIAAILEREPETAPSAYLGDDMTDEDAFKKINERGVSILVRSEIRPTVADVRLTPPEELIAFLNRWCAAVGGSRI
jgi:trehalose-phosphatase